jgi:uncharacterized protein with HEPN domain
MEAEIRKLLVDIDIYIQDIQLYLKDCAGFTEYEKNSMLQAAIERKLIITNFDHRIL